MLKRWVLKLAFWYMDRAFNKWLLTRSEEEKEAVIVMLDSFQKYLMSLRSPIGQQVSNLLEDWKD